MTNGFTHTDVIEILTSVNGTPNQRLHFELTTKCTTVVEVTTITYTITNFLDSHFSIIDLIVDNQVFPFDSGINPGNIGTVKFKRKGACVPALGSVNIENDRIAFEFGTLCTAILKGECSTPPV